MFEHPAVHPQLLRYAERSAGRAPLVNVLVVVDPATRSSASVEKAARIAQAYGSSVQLLSCVSASELPADWAGGTTKAAYHGILRERQIGALERLAEPLRKAGICVTSEAVCTDMIADAILVESLLQKSDLVIKELERQGPDSERHSTVDDRLMREIAAPLLLVHSTPWPFHPRICVAVDPCHPADRPASLDEAMIGTGRSLAYALAGGIELVHVLQSPPHLPGASVSFEARQAAYAHARSCVDELARRAGIPPDAIHYLVGVVPESISSLAHSAGADIIVVGASARPRLKSSHAGSASYLLDVAPSDLLVVKPPGFVSPVLEE
jgi:nucleotide-binding universal stress UspA family protein